MVPKPKQTTSDDMNNNGSGEAAGNAVANTETNVATPPSATSTESKSNSDPEEPIETKAPDQSQENNEVSVPPVSVEGLDISAAESTLVLGEDYQKMVAQIMEMGYPQDDVEHALGASFNNPDRAVEYLLSGTLPSEQESEVEIVSAAEESNSGSLGPTDQDPLASLRSEPQFQQMQQVLRSNPQLLNTILQQIGQNNPELLQLITQHREAFRQMLMNEPPTVLSGRSSPLESSLAHVSVEVTPQDKEAIERLKALGFPEYLVVQAYFACDQNENLAANFLLSQNYDE